MAREGQISWDDKSITPNRNELFKMDSKTKARICILTTKAEMILDHYSQKARRHVRCIGDGCPACEALGEPKQRFATKILVYGTDPDGDLLKPVKYKIMPWVFGADKYCELRNIQKEWGDLTKLDITVSCSDKTFQKMTFVPAAKCLWRSSEKFMENVKAKFKATKMDLLAILGKPLSKDEMMKRLGAKTQEDDGFSEADLDNVPDPTAGVDPQAEEDLVAGDDLVADETSVDVPDDPVDAPADDGGLEDIDAALDELM